ncbi:MAG: hypothetical protein AMXMBFR33_60470 [Candidatus Xenobia bacterium]
MIKQTTVSQNDIRQLFGGRAPVVEGPEVEIQHGRHALDLPAGSDTRLLGGDPLLVTRTDDGLVARDPDSGEERWHYKPPESGRFSWAASQDGQFLAVRQRNQIEVVRADEGKGVQTLALPPEAEYSTDPVANTHTIKFGPEHTLIADYKAMGRDGSRSWAEHNLAFFDLDTGQGPAVAHMGSVGHMAFEPQVAPDGQTLLCDDSYGLKALDLTSDQKLWQRNDVRHVKSVEADGQGRLAVLHSGGLEILDQETGKTRILAKKGWLADELHAQDERLLVQDWRHESMTSVRWDGSEEWNLKLPAKTTFKQVIVTDDLIYATAASEEEGYQVRLLLADPRTGDVLAQSQLLGHLRHGLPMFQAQEKVYLALEDGAISFSPADLKLDQLKSDAALSERPVGIEVGNNFVQVGGVRLKARG